MSVPHRTGAYILQLISAMQQKSGHLRVIQSPSMCVIVFVVMHVRTKQTLSGSQGFKK